MHNSARAFTRVLRFVGERPLQVAVIAFAEIKLEGYAFRATAHASFAALCCCRAVDLFESVVAP
jgi:hypothetical protein